MTQIIWSREQQLRDRHVRRSGDDYCRAFLGLLPQGQAWLGVVEPFSTLWRVCCGLAQYWGWIDGRAADLLERESDPRKTIELLPDWERAWGLPDPCLPEATSIGERQKMLITKMTWMGGQSREYFENLMKWLGYTITIKEYSPFMAGISQAGDTRGKARVRYDWCPDTDFISDGNFTPRPVPSGWCSRPGDDLPEGVQDDNFRWYVGGPEMRFTWTANAGQMGLVWFRAGESEAGVNPHLGFRPQEDLQCLLNRWKPSHTFIGMSFDDLPFGDNMQGTIDPLSNPIRWPHYALNPPSVEGGPGHVRL